MTQISGTGPHALPNLGGDLNSLAPKNIQPGSAATNDVDRFQAALNTANPEAVAPAGVTPPPNITPTVTPPPTIPTLGDQILRGMSAASQQVGESREQVARVVGHDNVSQADLLRANFALLESSAIVSAASKTTEKITQGLKTLQQG